MKEVFHKIVDPATFHGSMFYALVFLGCYLLVSRIIRKVTKKVLALQEKHPAEKAAIEFYAQLLQGGIFVILLILYFHLIPSLRSVGTALLASVSVVSVIGGFAAQKTLGNILAGLSLLIYKPFKLGDKIQVSAPGGVEIGTIQTIGLGYTILIGENDRKVIIPNGILLDSVVINIKEK